MEMSEKSKKIVDIVVKVFTGLVVAFAVFMMVFTIISVTTLDKNDRNLFGLRMYIVQTDSMSKSEKNKDMKVHFNAGDIVLIKKAKDPYALKDGQIIAFMSQNEDTFGETVTHMIRSVKTDGQGNTIGYVTFGTHTDTNDKALVEPMYVMGVYSGKLPKLGYFFEYLQTTPGYIVCILVPFVLLIGYQGINCVKLFKRYKGEQMAEINAERAQIAEERKESMEMLKELEALKAQLAAMNGNAPAAAVPTPVPAPVSTPIPEPLPQAEKTAEKEENAEPESNEEKSE